ncbi:MAG: hypothetical protein KBG15_23005 [Kofleriaceae bacterium]|nr:hypothetical protein [Kofleriaceae bacterium]
MSWIKRWLGRTAADSKASTSSAPSALPNFADFPNVGQFAQVEVAFSGAREGTEYVDLVSSLEAAVMPTLGPCVREGDKLCAANGLSLAPLLVSMTPRADGDVAVSSTIEVSHPSFSTPGIFEWQHCIGTTMQAALSEAFAVWAQGDLPVFINALRAVDLELHALEWPSSLATHGDKRRAILGPVLGIFGNAGPAIENGHEAGCPCCLFSQVLPTLRGLIDSHDVFGIRLFAARWQSGETAADCRINGADFPAGAAALRAYAATWPGKDMQTRKQYVMIHDRPLTNRAGANQIGNHSPSA